MILSAPNKNALLKYTYNLKTEEQALQEGKSPFKQSTLVGEQLGCHAGPVRGVVISGNDYLMATFSFDSVKVWQINFSAQNESLDITFKQNIDILNVLSMLILPGNKFLVLGTKEGDLILFDLDKASVIQTVDSAHKKEIWELAMHSSP